jgi:hypothetical protein
MTTDTETPTEFEGEPTPEPETEPSHEGATGEPPEGDDDA